MTKITIPRADIRIKLRLITDNIRKLRENSNYSQEYMAGKLCISQNTYSKLELGYTALTLERLILIAGILNTDILSLVNIFSDAGRQNGDNVFRQAPL
ncbi:helix-turn-helix domain-containing protein [Mucilaginibacter sp. SMC90]|uniref:helix-turn-helix domain-containing protein n=1 Tax=Mucilaginibacter sp. SMC90 TaxID=2929803 RepID=UPI001FB1DF5C|nr:helix-turn-helix transcriptional regulator [Mucilaginibacter sp. SMC90]UOE46971.1 helix-turn-helix domain-containing protein [Mucilaginibacter sp. SMC90]